MEVVVPTHRFTFVTRACSIALHIDRRAYSVVVFGKTYMQENRATSNVESLTPIVLDASVGSG